MTSPEPLIAFAVVVSGLSAIGSLAAAIAGWIQVRHRTAAMQGKLGGKSIKLDDLTDEQRKQILRALDDKK